MPTEPRSTTDGHVHDVLVIGGGPGGSSCAYWLADAGWDVAVVEKKRFPREKTCGDGLTPRAVRQLADMGLEGALAGAHRFTGLRAYGFGQSLELEWPSHPVFPSYGYTITRARPRRARRRASRQGRSDGLARHRGRPAAAGRRAGREGPGGRPPRRAPRRRARRRRRGTPFRTVWARSSRTRRPARRGRSGPATSSSPTARTRGSGGRSARPGRRTTRSGWRCAATTGRRGTTTR